MTTLYIVTRTDLEESESDTFRVAYKTKDAAADAILKDLNDAGDGEPLDGKPMTRADFELHVITSDEWGTEDFDNYGYKVTAVTVEE